jgi:formylglycine-generating enzyme
MKKTSRFSLIIFMIFYVLIGANCSKKTTTTVSTRTIHGITFVSIPGGTFKMGGSFKFKSGKDAIEVKMPVLIVTVKPFQMSEAEITNAQYCKYLNEAKESGCITIVNNTVKAIKGTYNGEYFLYMSGNWESDFPGNRCWIAYSDSAFSVVAGHENWPVVSVTWYGSKAFAEHYGWDLPREAEWEHACRGGKGYEYGTYNGKISSSKANVFGSIRHPVNVKSYPKNPFGLYDMSGNVSEWCSDRYENSSPAVNPTDVHTGLRPVVRGGGWANDGFYAYSFSSFPHEGNDSFGFRVVCR